MGLVKRGAVQTNSDVIAFEIYDFMPNWFVISVFAFGAAALLFAIFSRQG